MIPALMGCASCEAEGWCLGCGQQASLQGFGEGVWLTCFGIQNAESRRDTRSPFASLQHKTRDLGITITLIHAFAQTMSLSSCPARNQLPERNWECNPEETDSRRPLPPRLAGFCAAQAGSFM